MGRFRRILLAAFITAGIGLMGYPFIANWVFVHRADSLVISYDAEMDSTEREELEQARERARHYNEVIASGSVELLDPFTAEVWSYSENTYSELLNLSGTGLMGYISIPCLDLTLPINHGTDSEVLEKGVGHLAGSSLPIGGASTHCVLTGHTGLSSTRLFTDLTQMEVGDVFILTVLDEKLAYEVDQILMVEPYDVSALRIESGMDYCTLVTCTPYGVNTHRLLVRGVRTEYVEEYEEPGAISLKAVESHWMNEYVRALAVSLVLLIAALFVILAVRARRSRRSHG